MSLSTSFFTAGCDLRHSRDSSSIFLPQNFERSRERSSSSPSLDHEASASRLLITEARVGETLAIKTSASEMDVGVWRKTVWFPFRKLDGFYTRAPYLFLEGPPQITQPTLSLARQSSRCLFFDR